MKVELNITKNGKISLKTYTNFLDSLTKIEGISITDGLLRFEQPIHVETLDSFNVDHFIRDKWMPLFPTDSISGGGDFGAYRVSGNSKECKRYMSEFMSEFEYNAPTIMLATCWYLNEKLQSQWRGTLKNYNFIRKELEVYCIEVEKTPEIAILKAKNYILYVRKYANRQRGRKLQELNLDKSLRESFGINSEESGDSNPGTILIGRGDVEPTGDVQPRGRLGRSGGSGGGTDDGCGHIQSLKLRKSTGWGINKSRK